MADPPTIPPVASPQTNQSIDGTVGALQNLDAGYIQTTASALDFTNVQQTQVSLFNGLSDQISAYTDKLGTLQGMTDSGSASFGLLSAALIKTTQSFRDFTGGIDKNRVVSFSEQYSKLLTTIRESPVGSTAASVGIDALSASLSKSGVAHNKIAVIAGDLKKGIISTAESFLTSADNTLFYQNALIQTAAAQGNMQKLLAQTGDGFEHLNEVTKTQIDTMENAMAATNLDKEHMQKYMDVLKNLPGGMQNFGETVQVGGQHLNILTAAIQYATGSGRDMAAVQTDMSEAMNSYGANVQDALKYSARMSQMSETLGARVEDVQAAVNGSAEAFKSFVWGGAKADDMTKGLSDAMEMYAKRLNNIGVPIKNAIEMSKNLQSQMSNMSVGQEAFISQQTGGPGGVRGALQYERLMKEHPEQAMQKMDQNLRKMMGGKLVTEKEAEGSDVAANQFMKQTMLLQQWTGTQNRQQAEAMSDAMASGNLKQASQKGTMEETVQRGQAMEQLSMTKVGQMNVQTDSVQLSGGVTNLGTLQDTMAARSGSGAGGQSGTGRGVNVAEQDKLRAYAANRATGPAPASALQELLNSAKELPQSFKDIASNFADAVKSGDADKEKMETEELKERITTLKATGKTDQANAAQKMLDTMQQTMGAGSEKQAAPTAPTIPGLGSGLGGGFGPNKHPIIPGLGGAIHAPAGKQVGAVIPGLAGSGTSNSTGTGTHTPGAAATIPGLGGKGATPIPVTLAPGTTITVEHTGTCPHCGKQSTSTEQARARNTTPTASSI
jgi:hypothetical protein